MQTTGEFSLSHQRIKVVVLHNGNKHASAPVTHGVQLKETYENVAVLFENIKYAEHNWLVCGDRKREYW